MDRKLKCEACSGAHGAGNFNGTSVEFEYFLRNREAEPGVPWFDFATFVRLMKSFEDQR